MTKDIKDKFKSYENKPSKIKQFRDRYLKKGIELVNIMPLITLKLGKSGWCNSFNEPDEEIYHIQIWYREEEVGVIGPDKGYVIDDDKYALFVTEKDIVTGSDFIMFMKVKIK